MEQDQVVVTAFVAALVEGVRHMGRYGVHEDRLYASVAKWIDRRGFDMVVAELVAQRTLKYDRPGHLAYCGPSPIEPADADGRPS